MYAARPLVTRGAGVRLRVINAPAPRIAARYWRSSAWGAAVILFCPDEHPAAAAAPVPRFGPAGPAAARVADLRDAPSVAVGRGDPAGGPAAGVARRTGSAQRPADTARAGLGLERPTSGAVALGDAGAVGATAAASCARVA